MKVILKENIDNLGYIGDTVEVNKGYARNFLFPRGLAMEYSIGNQKSIEHLKKKEWEKRNRELMEAKELGARIDRLELIFRVKAGKDGKLFGSITNKDIAQYLLDNHQIEIDRKKIEQNENLKKIGEYVVNIRLHKEVNSSLNIKIVQEEEPKKAETIQEKNKKEETAIEEPGQD